MENANRFAVLSTELSETDSTQLSHMVNGPTSHFHQNSSTWKNKTFNKKCKNKATSISGASKRQLLILADSHGKNLSHSVEQRSTLSVFSCVRPGAKFRNVIEDIDTFTKNMQKEDTVLVIAGSNNIETMSSTQFLNELQSLFERSKDTNLILATLPLRYDQPNLDLKISSINKKLEDMAAKNNCFTLPLHHLPRHLFTNHGQHLNKRGKARVSEMVVTIITGEGKTEITQPTTNTNSNSSQPFLIGNGISVIETNMKDIFGKINQDSSVALAHTISSDFQHPNHMSAGVAVAFREK